MSYLQASLPWHRFWCPLGSVIHCGDYGDGFLTDPEDKFGQHANPAVRRLAELLPEAGPIVLCGEPGIGKSTELAAIRANFQSSIAPSSTDCCWLAFDGIADLNDFRRRTVESEAWKQWRAGSSMFTLVVDGVDEGLLRVSNFVNDLRTLLEGEPFERLRLILACRTAEWPVAQGQRLLSLWSSNSLAPLYELCPLRYKDVEIAAIARGYDPKLFLRKVWARKATVLAARPITLFFLLDEFRQNHDLPATHRELYENGTTRLAREVNQERLELLRNLRRSSPGVTDSERLRAAQQLACLSLISGNTGILASSGVASPQDNRDLFVHSAIGQGVNGVTAEALDEAMETALFTALGERRFGFVHRTFAECLASARLHTLPLVQLRRLLCQRDERGEHVIPQLGELAAWVAGSHSAFGEHILSIEPEVLLRSDVARLQNSFKSRLVEAILRGAREDRIFDRNESLRFFGALSHPGLDAQLRPVISDPTGHYIERRFAMSIAGECDCTTLTDCLLARINDTADSEHMREQAASALEDLVQNTQLHLLEPLAKGEVAPDSDDSIKGYALRRLIPQHWNVRNALPYLTPRKNTHFIGSYNMVIDHNLPKAVAKDDLLPILTWLRPQKHCLDTQATFHRLASVTFSKALSFLDEAPIADLITELWQLWCLRDHCHLSQDSEIVAAFEADEHIRRQLAALYLNHPNTPPDVFSGIFYPYRLLKEGRSLDWLLEQIADAPSTRRAAWASAIGYLANDPNVACACWDKLLRRIETVPELAERFSWLRPWNLQDDESVKAKERSRKEQVDAARQARRSSLANTAKNIKKIQSGFAQYSQGHDRAWLALWQGLITAADGRLTHYFVCDVSTCPNCALLSDEQRALVPKVARAYLLSDVYDEVASRREGHFYAARCAVWMLKETLADEPMLRAAVLDHWLHTVVYHVDSDAAPQRDLFRSVYAWAPERLREVLTDTSQAEALKYRHPNIFRVAADCWDSHLSEVALGVIRTSYDSLYVINALDELAERDLEVVMKYGEDVLNSVSVHALSYPIGFFGAMTTCLIRDAERIWPVADPHLRNDGHLARAALTRMCEAMDMGHRTNSEPLSEQMLAKLFLMIRHWFPPANDPPHRGGEMTAYDTVRRVRGKLLEILAERGTESGCDELGRLAQAVSPDEATWVRWMHKEAVTNVRRNLWQPPSADIVKTLLEQFGARLLSSDDDLLELVIESLDRLQTKLKRQSLPRAEDLWRWEGSGLKRSRFSPKDEEALADHVASWLLEDLGSEAGVVVNREVQPRRGSRTDIIVEAITPANESGFQKLTVVIEVKGCWHSEVLTGLESQLVNGYLKEHAWRCGLYLVGWFICSQWENPKNELQSDTLAEAREELSALATPFDGEKSVFKAASYLLDCTLPSAKAPSA